MQKISAINRDFLLVSDLHEILPAQHHFGGKGKSKELRQCCLIITLIREAGKDHTQNPRETAVMRRALMALNRCEKAKAMV